MSIDTVLAYDSMAGVRATLTHLPATELLRADAAWSTRGARSAPTKTVWCASGARACQPMHVMRHLGRPLVVDPPGPFDPIIFDPIG
jgi:hypothetical protein